MRPGLVPIGPFVFFYIITYLFLKVKFPRVITNTREAYGEAFSYALRAYGIEVLGHSVAICANRSGFREPGARYEDPLLPSKFCHMGYRSEIRYLAFVQGPLYLLLLYHTRAHLSSVFSKKNPRILVLGSFLVIVWVEAVLFATVTACHIVCGSLFIVGASTTTKAFAVADVIVIGVPHCGEVVAFVHGVFKGTLTRDRTVAVVWTVPTIYGAMDVSHYSSPPIAFISSAKASIIMQPISISAFSP
jgi:hypothetical protein